MPRKGGWRLTQVNVSLRECRAAVVIATMVLTADLLNRCGIERRWGDVLPNMLGPP
jgi:hypothetical protein